MTRVFLSHSSRADAFAGQVRDAVKRGLGGYDVFVDMDVLQPGEEWRSVLYHELAQCSAAVVLLNREALASPWVRREVNILLWRRALGAPLWIVPALLGDLRTADVKAAGLSELEPLEFARIAHPDLTAAAAEELAGKILERFAGLPSGGADKSAMCQWVSAVAAYLNEVTNVDSLVAAAELLRVDEQDLDRVRIPEEGCRFLAHQLIARALDVRLEKVIAAIAEFTPVEWLGRLIDKIQPTWVDGEAARGLLVVCDRPHRTAVLNARSAVTAEHYYQRATCCALTGYRHATVSAVFGAAPVPEFVNACRVGLRELLDVPDDFPLEESLPEVGEEPNNTCFLVIDPQDTKLELIAPAMRQVRDSFPWLTMVLLSGKKEVLTAELLESWGLCEAFVLSPELQPDEERRALTADMALRNLRRMITRQSGGQVA